MSLYDTFLQEKKDRKTSLYDEYLSFKVGNESLESTSSVFDEKTTSLKKISTAEPTSLYDKFTGFAGKVIDGTGKFLARTGVEAANLLTSTLDFTSDFLASTIEKKIRTPSGTFGTAELPETEGSKRLADKWKSFYESTAGKQTEEIKSFTEKLKDIDYIKPSEEWQKSSLQEKFTTKLPETILNIGPGVVSSLGAFAINPILGFTLSTGSVADDINKTAQENGVDKRNSELLGLGTGLLVGYLDKIVPDELFSPQQKQKFFSGLMKKVIKTGLKETGTEILQEDVQILVESTLRDDLKMDEVIVRNTMAGLGGFLGGSGAQTTVSFINNVRSGGIADIYNKDTEQKSDDNKFSFKPAKDLSPEMREIETRFGKNITENYTKLSKDYDEKFGKVLNTDNARELSNDYNDDRTMSAAVHEPSSEFIKRRYAEKLAETPKTNKILFTAGGTGAGKSTSIRDAVDQKFEDDYDLIYDTNLNTLNSSKEKIEQAIASGRDVVIGYVHNDPVSSLENAAKRAMRMGRTVPLESHIATHVGSPKVLLQLAEDFKDNPKVGFFVIDNTHGKGNAKEADLDLIKKIQYNETELKNELNEKLTQLYENGKINEKIFKGFKGISSGVRKADGEKNNGKSQPESSEREINSSLLESEQAREAETKDTPKAQKTRAEIDKLRQDVEMKEQDKAVKRSILEQFTGKQIQIMRILKRSINKRIEAGRDAKTIEETEAYKDNVRDLMSVLKKGEDDVVSEDDVINFIQNDLPDSIIDADTKEELEKIKVLQSRLTPKEITVNRGVLPVGTGKPNISRMEARIKGILENATPEQKQELGTVYNTMNKKEQIEMAMEYVASYRAEAMEVLQGKRNPPPGLIPESIYIALTELSKGDITLATKLASLQATALGQRISILTELDKDSPVKLLNEVYKIREEKVKKKYGNRVKEKIKEVKNEVKKQVKVDKYDWDSFISSLEC